MLPLIRNVENTITITEDPVSTTAFIRLPHGSAYQSGPNPVLGTKVLISLTLVFPGMGLVYEGPGMGGYLVVVV